MGTHVSVPIVAKERSTRHLGRVPLIAGFGSAPGSARHIAVLIAAVAVAACGGTSVTPTPNLRSSGITWLFNSPALDQMTGDNVAMAELRRGTVYVVLRVGQSPPAALPSAIRTASYASFKAMTTAADAGKLTGFGAVIYDNEKWSFTPQEEQVDPAGYTQRAAALAHQHHLKLIATPATNLVSVLRPAADIKYQAFLDLGLAAAASRYADIFDIQAQGSIGDLAKFTDFVTKAAAQAKATNPHVLVLAGLSTNPSAGAPPAGQLFSAIRATRHSVDGYWMNIPMKSAYCPNCSSPRPDLAIEALHQLQGV